MPGGEELRRIFQHVEDGLFHQRRMHPDRRQVGGQVQLQAHVGLVTLQAADGRADQFVHADPVAIQGQPGVAKPGHIEQILDVAIQSLAFELDGVEQAVAIVRVHRIAVAGQAAGRADHRGQRRAQVVDTDDNNAERRRSVSPLTRAPSRSATRRVRSAAWPMSSTIASAKRRCSRPGRCTP